MNHNAGVSFTPYFFRAYTLLAVFFLASCSLIDGPKIDTKRFRAVDRAARSVGAAISTGTDYGRFNELIEEFAEEISRIQISAGSAGDAELLKHYQNLLGIYRDGLVVWRYKLEAPRYDFIPPGRIYVGQDVEPIVEKYRFSVETHVYLPTDKTWKSMSEESLRVIWMNARSQMEVINRIMRR
ncbi:MAG: hypothetical protein P8013_05060 [Candidatus Sulfobium sp.]|jgi:hypothetical protein